MLCCYEYLCKASVVSVRKEVVKGVKHDSKEAPTADNLNISFNIAQNFSSSSKKEKSQGRESNMTARLYNKNIRFKVTENSKRSGNKGSQA